MSLTVGLLLLLLLVAVSGGIEDPRDHYDAEEEQREIDDELIKHGFWPKHLE